MAFDHEEIALAGRRAARAKLSYTNVGFALAPETFTISELRELYAAALGHPVSTTNLQRVLVRRGLLPAGERREPGPTGGRPAAVFRFLSPPARDHRPVRGAAPPGCAPPEAGVRPSRARASIRRRTGADLARDVGEAARRRRAVRSVCQTRPMRRGGRSVQRHGHGRPVVEVDREPGDDRDPEAGADHPLDGAVVVGAEDEVRAGARGAEVRLEQLHERQTRKPMSGSSRISSSDGALRRAAGGEPAWTRSTYGSSSRCSHSNGPSQSRKSAKVRSRSPRSTRRTSSWSVFISVMRNSTLGHAERKRRISVGSTRWPMDW